MLSESSSDDQLSHYDYSLPEELIASRPAASRDEARMLVLDRKDGSIRHCRVTDLPGFFSEGDLAVLNDSKVLPARLLTNEGRTEVFFLQELTPTRWECLVRPGRRFRMGSTGQIAGATFSVVELGTDGSRILEFDQKPDLHAHGKIPLPPYIRRDSDEEDATRYQTVFARVEGSVAAPTAGLHFTPELLARIPHCFVTLHVGLGTFSPVKSPTLQGHLMHTERYSISAQAALAINSAKCLLAVGTTSVRVLESRPSGPVQPCADATRLFIKPPFHFQRTGALLTNFHLPRSTLLVLVSTFAGHEKIRAAYAEAIRERYRFFSYGDCMLIL